MKKTGTVMVVVALATCVAGCAQGSALMAIVAMVVGLLAVGCARPADEATTDDGDGAPAATLTPLVDEPPAVVEAPVPDFLEGKIEPELAETVVEVAPAPAPAPRRRRRARRPRPPVAPPVAAAVQAQAVEEAQALRREQPAYRVCTDQMRRSRVGCRWEGRMEGRVVRRQK